MSERNHLGLWNLPFSFLVLVMQYWYWCVLYCISFTMVLWLLVNDWSTCSCGVECTSTVYIHAYILYVYASNYQKKASLDKLLGSCRL